MSDVEDDNLKNETKRKPAQINVGVNISNNDHSNTKIDYSQVDEGDAKKKKIIKYSVIGGGILVALILIIVLSVTLSGGSAQSGPLPPNPPGPAPTPNPIFVDVDPFHFQEYNLYTTASVQAQDWLVGTVLNQPVTLGSSAPYQVGDPFDGRTYQPVNPKLINEGLNNRFATQVELQFALIDNYQAQLIVTDPNNANNYNVSDYAFPRPVQSFEARFTQVGFVQSSSPDPYSFNFTNIYNGETLISTYKRKLVISERFSEIGFVLPTNRLFGLGQHNSQFQLSNGTYTLWARGRQSGLPDDNGEGGLNGPHIHPFILCQTQNKDFFGIFFAGSAAQSFEIIQYQGDDRVILNYISMGGQLEIYFIMRGTAQEILSRYHAIIGYSQVPPYFALGFFQGSNSYENLAQIQAVVQGYADANMALEGIILDNYYEANQVFTVDQYDFKDLQTYTAALNADNQYLLLGIQSGVSTFSEGYKIYDDLIASQCVVQSTVNSGQNLIGMQETEVVYPDYMCADDITEFFKNSIENLDPLSLFSGLLLQNNELYSVVSGEVTVTAKLVSKRNLQSATQVTEDNSGSWNGSYQINPDQSKVSTYSIPYIPGYEWSGNLDNQAISLNATHQDRGNVVEEYYVHNINGHMNLKEVYSVLSLEEVISSSGQRPFLFTDSTWAGSGAFGAVALSDMWRTWSNLKTTISQAMSFSMYGISNVASDVCGSIGPIDGELCGRWAQLSAFLPLMRGYYNMTYQDPATLADTPNPASELYNLSPYGYEFMASAAVDQRLQYTRYIYSQMYKVYLKGGALVYPLFFDYPEDDAAFENVDTTYMLGDAIKVSPVLEAGVTGQYQSYFPAGIWADLNQRNVTISSSGEMINLDQSYAYTNIHLKEGHIIPYQDNYMQFKRTADLLTQEGISFIIHRDTSDYAEGYTLVDDGSSQSTWDNVDFTFWKLRYAEKSINFWVEWGDYSYTPPVNMTVDHLKSIIILNAEDLSGTNFACYLGTNLVPENLTIQYNPYDKYLTLSTISGSTLRFMDIGFIKFGNSFQEPNFCDYNTAFTYQVVDIDIETKTPQYQAMTIQSLQQSRALSQLVVSVRLLDNSGTISLNITTVEDFNNGTFKFKPPFVADITQFPESQVSLSLDQFFTFTANPFSYTIYKQDNPDAILYKSDPNKLYFEDYLIFDSGVFPLNPLTNYPLMGLGERAGSLFYNEDGIHSRYTYDQANPIDDGKPPGRNLYGFQPVYYYQSTTTDWVGVFDLNSYATDYLLKFDSGFNFTDAHITKVSIGGMIQKYFFVGSKPDDVISKYTKLVGNPVIPPIWAFGWQQCRFGWTTDQQWIDVVNSYEANNLPLDTMWADIDYMDDYKIFTISQSRYSNLATYVDQIRAKGMTFVPIMDVGVAVRPNESYFAYDQGISNDVFIKQYDNSAPLTAGVWCGHAYFPDFFNPNINDYWHSSFDYLTSEYGLNFDGIWIDMNEATNFCNGYCIPSERPVDSLRNKPYYVPGWRDLEDKALGVDGLHPGVWNGQDLHEYDVHNMYSLMQVKSTSEYLSEKKGLRPFVLSRSNFPGMGKYGHHWIGDNWSTVDYMAVSVDGIYSYNLFGLPFMGSDICGFDGDAPADLCTRWHQLGSLYPFSRNHNQNASTSQEPYVFDTPYPRDDSMTYTDIIRVALRNRYSLIKYYYSRFQDMHTFGGSFFKPLFFEFVSDPLAYTDIEINILLGDALKASIQVTSVDESVTPTTNFYFPEGSWCQMLPAISASTQCFVSPAEGTTLTLSSYLTDYYVHLRGGYIVAAQEVFSTNVNTTKDLEQLPTNFAVLPLTANAPLSTHYSSVTAAAVGYIYFDDGVTLVQTPTRFELALTLNGANSATWTFSSVIADSFPAQNKPHESVGSLQIYAATNCQLNGATTSATATLNDQSTVTLMSGASYDATTDVLTLDVVDGSGNRISLYQLQSIQIQ